MAPWQLGGGAVEVEKKFKFWGLLVKATGRMTEEIDCRIVQASKALGSLHSAVFMSHDLNVETKRLVYYSVVLGVLFYDAEMWTPTQVLIRELERFYHHCVHCIMHGCWEGCTVSTT